MTASEDHPTETDARHIAWRFSGTRCANVRRFSTGTGHWVYDVRTSEGMRFVVRLGAMSQRDDLLGALHWSKTLRPLGVPLPELLGYGEHRGYPYLILEHLEGYDTSAKSTTR